MVSLRGIEISQLTDNTYQKRLIQNNIKINVKQRFFVGLSSLRESTGMASLRSSNQTLKVLLKRKPLNLRVI